MRKCLLIWVLVLSLTVAVLGCQSPTADGEPDPVASNEPGTPDTETDPPAPDGEPDPVDPNEPGTPDTETDPLTAVPQEFAEQNLMAVIRQGDLWLMTEGGQGWRQTDSGNVADIIWRPDGHCLAYTVQDGKATDLYCLVPGLSPVPVDQDIQLIAEWPNTPGMLWSPESTQLAYSAEGGNKLCVIDQIADVRHSYTLDNPIRQGPFWLTEDVLIYTTRQNNNIPATVLIEAEGKEITVWDHTTAPFPRPGKALVATGPFNLEGPIASGWSGLALISVEKESKTPIYDQPVRFNYLEFADNAGNTFALANWKELLLLEETAGNFTATQLLSQDMLVTYSEFAYPLWFAWAPDGQSLAALEFIETKAEDSPDGQEGYWDMVIVDRAGNSTTLLNKIYTFSDGFSYGETENPLNFTAPMNWSPSGKYLYYISGSRDATDLWRVSAGGGKAELFLENSSLPLFRPQP